MEKASKPQTQNQFKTKEERQAENFEKRNLKVSIAERVSFSVQRQPNPQKIKTAVKLVAGSVLGRIKKLNKESRQIAGLAGRLDEGLNRFEKACQGVNKTEAETITTLPRFKTKK